MKIPSVTFISRRHFVKVVGFGKSQIKNTLRGVCGENLECLISRVYLFAPVQWLSNAGWWDKSRSKMYPHSNAFPGPVFERF